MMNLVLNGLIILAVHAALQSQSSAADSSSSPTSFLNIVMIVSDDQAYTDYGFMGHQHIRTPRLDELSRQSLTFRHGYVTSSLCRPSLATILTGYYPHQHRITSNDPPPAPTAAEQAALRQRQIAYMEKAPTLPRLLASKGYVSFQTGKWWEGDFKRGGFTHGMTHGDPAKRGRHGDEGLQIGRDGIEPVRKFLDETAGRPFFLWYAPMMPHQPHNPPERFKAHYRGKAESPSMVNYWAMCEWFDETCGELLDEIDRRGLTDNTLVVYVTDNGWLQDPASPQFAPRSKRSPYDGGLRTPIMLRWPGRIEPKLVDTPVSSIDLAPTILRAAGVEPPAAIAGVDLRDAAAVAGRKTIFGEIFSHDAVDIDRPAASLEYRWCVSWPWKLIAPNAAMVPKGKLELFNVADDPWETRNLAAEQPEVVERLTRELDAWWNPADEAAAGGGS